MKILETKEKGREEGEGEEEGLTRINDSLERIGLEEAGANGCTLQIDELF